MAARKRWEDGSSDGRGGTTDALISRRDASNAFTKTDSRHVVCGGTVQPGQKKAARRDLRAARG